ncbi:IclR family transcriptional regulator [Haladaptatus sp. R4]|uniref:IclR family transcriptional regulator n=1 Tax=Haladaptatus sp. R4 TaxID=1679489 RepID=UPI0007B4F6D5|nr:IclR family transcriptional regulator [Haladaptatus sp. R4]KZN26235.1 IclR family transcriptional regulator [Haladaptatus sp. R4]
MARDGNGSKTIKSVGNAFRVLDALDEHERMGVTALADEVGLSKGTVHHYLATLLEHDFVERADGEYQLGLRPLTYGGAVRERETVFQIGKESVDRLAKTTGETARLVVERHGYGITLYQSTRHDRADINTHLGTQEDLHSTAAGKAMLAAMDGTRIDEVLDWGALHRYTDGTIVEESSLRAELDDIRSRGIAFDDEEQFEGVRCVATALVTETDELLGAISVSGPVERIDDDTFRREIPQEIRNVAGVIEVNTAYLDWME